MTQEALLTEAQGLPNLPFEEVSKLSAVTVPYLEELLRRSEPIIQAHQTESTNLYYLSSKIGANPELVYEITYIGYLIKNSAQGNGHEPLSSPRFQGWLEEHTHFFQLPQQHFWDYCIAALEAKKILGEYYQASPKQDLFPEPSSHHSIEEQMRDVLKIIEKEPGLGFQEIQQCLDYKLSGRVIGNLHQEGKIEIRHKNKHERTRYFSKLHSLETSSTTTASPN